MKPTLELIAAGLAIFVGAMPAFAHHSFAVEYDANKPIEGSGVITKVEWTNPHMRVYVEVADANGVATT